LAFLKLMMRRLPFLHIKTVAYRKLPSEDTGLMATKRGLEKPGLATSSSMNVPSKMGAAKSSDSWYLA